MSTEGVGKPYACACCGVALSEARRRGRDHSLLFRWLTRIGCKEIAPTELRGIWGGGGQRWRLKPARAVKPGMG